MNKAMAFMIFAVGAAAGSVGTWYYAKKKYEQIAQEEIDSVKAAYSKKDKKKTETNKETKEEKSDISTDIRYKPTQSDVMKYATELSKNGYTDYGHIQHAETEPYQEPLDEEAPYVIEPEEFGEFDDYRKIFLSYYKDKVLADDSDEIVDDVEGTVGYNSLNQIGKYEEDAIHVRNDRLKCDYEIVLDLREFTEVAKFRPHPIEM